VEQVVLEGWLSLSMFMVTWLIFLLAYGIVAWKLYINRKSKEVLDFLVNWLIVGGIAMILITLIIMGFIYEPILKIMLGGRFQ
jgi:hypothetical protein